MTILARVPDSVLWLLDRHGRHQRAPAQDCRRRTASRRSGIVFADKKANPEHLARYPLADLFLDSLPYGAHTTASDALWMGVPILTLSGRSFASRVCAAWCAPPASAKWNAPRRRLMWSAPSNSATTGRSSQPIKEKLIAGRDTCLLFDTPKLVRHLEDAYRQMWSDVHPRRGAGS